MSEQLYDVTCAGLELHDPETTDLPLKTNFEVTHNVKKCCPTHHRTPINVILFVNVVAFPNFRHLSEYEEPPCIKASSERERMVLL